MTDYYGLWHLLYICLRFYKLRNAHVIRSNFNTFWHHIKYNLFEKEWARTSCKKVVLYSEEVNYEVELHFCPMIPKSTKKNNECDMEGRLFFGNLMPPYFPESRQFSDIQLFFTIYSFILNCTTTYPSMSRLTKSYGRICFLFDKAHTGEYESGENVNMCIVNFSRKSKQYLFNLERNRLYYPYVLQMYYR